MTSIIHRYCNMQKGTRPLPPSSKPLHYGLLPELWSLICHWSQPLIYLHSPCSSHDPLYVPPLAQIQAMHVLLLIAIFPQVPSWPLARKQSFSFHMSAITSLEFQHVCPRLQPELGVASDLLLLLETLQPPSYLACPNHTMPVQLLVFLRVIRGTKKAKYVCGVGCSGQSESRRGALLHLAPNLEAIRHAPLHHFFFFFFFLRGIQEMDMMSWLSSHRWQWSKHRTSTNKCSVRPRQEESHTG